MLDTESNKWTEGSGFYNDRSGGSELERREQTNTDASSAVTSSIRARANAAASCLNSPTKASRAISKKQQKLAEAAKSSRNISQYFAKKQTVEEAETPKGVILSHTTALEAEDNSSQREHSPVTVEDVEISPVESETQDVIQEESKNNVIVILDDEEEETEMLELERLKDTSKEYKSE